MSKDWYGDIITLQSEVFKHTPKGYPGIPDEKEIKLKKMLIEEEVKETLDAIDANDLVEIADGIVDSIVVLLGAAAAYGLPMRALWDEVHRTNMAKKDAPVREDGKVLKPKDWEPPQIEKILKECEEAIKLSQYCDMLGY